MSFLLWGRQQGRDRVNAEKGSTERRKKAVARFGETALAWLPGPRTPKTRSSEEKRRPRLEQEQEQEKGRKRKSHQPRQEKSGQPGSTVFGTVPVRAVSPFFARGKSAAAALLPSKIGGYPSRETRPLFGAAPHHLPFVHGVMSVERRAQGCPALRAIRPSVRD